MTSDPVAPPASRRVARVAVAVGVLGVAVFVLVVLLRPSGGSFDPASDTPCHLFEPSIASELLGGDVERVLIVDQLPEDATADDRRRAAAADETNCAYVLAGRDVETGPVAGFQLDRRAFPSVEQFREGHSQWESVAGLGRAAAIDAREQGGWAVSVLVDDEFSFALVVSGDVVTRDALLKTASEFVEVLSA